jgi:hypothetical protein
MNTGSKSKALKEKKPEQQKPGQHFKLKVLNMARRRKMGELMKKKGVLMMNSCKLKQTRSLRDRLEDQRETGQQKNKLPSKLTSSFMFLI